MYLINPETIVAVSTDIASWLNDPMLPARLAEQSLPQVLQDQLKRELRREGDLVLLDHTYTQETLTAWRNVGFPPNQIESLCSHTHIEDSVDGDREALFLQGLAFALKLRDRLAPYGNFLVYLILSQNTSGETACSVQYHKKRSAEILWGESPGWDILILKTGLPEKSQ
jgi:hypothetical protein